jgi:hypothetical protein
MQKYSGGDSNYSALIADLPAHAVVLYCIIPLKQPSTQVLHSVIRQNSTEVEVLSD